MCANLDLDRTLHGVLGVRSRFKLISQRRFDCTNLSGKFDVSILQQTTVYNRRQFSAQDMGYVIIVINDSLEEDNILRVSCEIKLFLVSREYNCFGRIDKFRFSEAFPLRTQCTPEPRHLNINYMYTGIDFQICFRAPDKMRKTNFDRYKLCCFFTKSYV